VVALAFIVIDVGDECELGKTNLRQYGWGSVVAMTATAMNVVRVIAWLWRHPGYFGQRAPIPGHAEEYSAKA
jgi:hypothetical protein